jgi:hypothetical protein
MAITTRSVAVGIFENKTDAQNAVEELRRAGFRDDQIGVAARSPNIQEEVRQGEPAGSGETHAEEGATIGAMSGAGVGALWGLAVAAGVFPPLGPVIAGGALAAILASAALGAAAGGLVGVLVGWGIPEDEARQYEEDLRAGHILVAVRANGRSQEAITILRRCNARMEPYAVPH